MALNPKNWVLNSYDVNKWEVLVDAAVETLVKNVIMSVGANQPTVSVRVVNQFGSVANTLVPGEVLDTNRGYKLDLDLIVLEKHQKIQVYTNVPGCSFSANGIEKGPDTGNWAAANVRLAPVTATGQARHPFFSGTPSIAPITAAGTATVTP